MKKDLIAVTTLLAGALLNLVHLSCQYEIQDVLPLCSGDVDPVVTLGIREKSASLIQLNFNPTTMTTKSFLDCNITIRPPEGHSVAVVVQQTNFRKRESCLDYIQLYGKDRETEPLAVCRTVNISEKMVDQPRGVFSDQVQVRIQVANSSILNQSQGNVSFILAATAYKTGTACDVSSEFACSDVNKPGCMWRGLFCDGFINCPLEGTDEYSFSCTKRRTDVLISYPAIQSRNVSGDSDNTASNNNESPKGKLTIEDFFALCIMGFLIATTLIFIAKIFAECFRNCFGLKGQPAQSSQTSDAICEAGEATPPQREISRPPSYETCMKELDTTRPPSYSKCLYRLQELEVSQLSQALYMSQASQATQVACGATSKPLEGTQPCSSSASSAAPEERSPPYESLLSTPGISHSGNWMTQSSQGYSNPALLSD